MRGSRKPSPREVGQGATPTIEWALGGGTRETSRAHGRLRGTPRTSPGKPQSETYSTKLEGEFPLGREALPEKTPKKMQEMHASDKKLASQTSGHKGGDAMRQAPRHFVTWVALSATNRSRRAGLRWDSRRALKRFEGSVVVAAEPGTLAEA